MVQWLLLLSIQNSQRSKILDITSLFNKATLNTKLREVENKIIDITSFICITEFNRLTKKGFDARIKAATKSLARESEVDTALDIADKNREEIKKCRIRVTKLNYSVFFKSFTTNSDFSMEIWRVARGKN